MDCKNNDWVIGVSCLDALEMNEAISVVNLMEHFVYYFQKCMMYLFKKMRNDFKYEETNIEKCHLWRKWEGKVLIWLFG